ncbi:hypothetical protein GH714_035666 [Hevea brasiliensis]|uniref:C2H2-type domain-containing protein n=1 Tax=Hevea brasiliensis TaxID=3981 RepID=A0A6A6KY38_HEVBR|nr:hypothetical protein GH714_035666 [Hevea brasiliensis]
MSNPAESAAFPTEYSVPVGSADLRVSLRNLSTVQVRMDSLQQFLSESVNNNTLISKAQMDMVSAEISSAIHQIIVNGAALLAGSQPVANFSLKVEERDDFDVDCDIVELDAVELLAEHVHFCEICGKGFKRDANLRMHMRAHGNQFKTPEALAKPDKGSESSAAAKRKTRFSCPFEGCNRNKKHKKFRPLKSVICVRNHFKRSHCPKMYSCNRCNKKSFSVVADLKSHLKHCGETRWKCSCGTTFSRKDKLFGHLALFEGHMPAVVGEDDNRAKGGVIAMEEDEQEEVLVKEGELLGNCADNGFFEGLLDGFASIEGYNLEDVLGSPRNGWVGGMENLSGIGRS